MSVSYYVTGIISETNDSYQKHLKVLNACIEAGIKKLPEETAQFFNAKLNDKPSEHMIEDFITREIPHDQGSGGYGSHYLEIKVSNIPTDVEIIRFNMSY